MTRREAGIVAFGLATVGLAVAIVAGQIPQPGSQGTRLPTLNGTPPPQATPGNPEEPATGPSSMPSGSAPSTPAVRGPVALNPRVEGEDETETEDEPASTEPGSSTAAGSVSRPSSGSGGPVLLPALPPVPLPSPVSPPPVSAIPTVP